LTPIHVYFPTEESTGRSVLIHGDFVIDSRRAQIHRKGPAGELNERFARDVAAGLADLAQTLAPRHSRQVCAALAQSGRSSAFGKVVNDALVATLRMRCLVRAFAKKPVPVSDARRITELGAEWERRLLPLLSTRQGLLEPGYEESRARDLLRELALETTSPVRLVERVRIPKERSGNESSLALLQQWCDELSPFDRERVYQALREIPLLRDTAGHLSRPFDVAESVNEGPLLPPALRKRQLAPISDPLAHRLVDSLEVDHLDATASLEILLDAIEEGSYARRASEHEAVRTGSRCRNVRCARH